MTEMRLPRRLVLELSDVIYKKTSGHAIFVAQLLNSLVRDSTISYSPQKRRFHWGWDEVLSLKTWDSVAGLIVSNLSSLQPGALLTLRILSCFGIQLHISVIDVLDTFPRRPNEGIDYFLPSLVEEGILENDFPWVTFSHDLIQQQVYESMTLEQRKKLHLELGIFLGSKTVLDNSETIEAGIKQLSLSDGYDTAEGSVAFFSSLMAIATEQINYVGPEFFHDESRKIKFACWNLTAGKLAVSASNFRAALYYFEKGITFLGEGVLMKDKGVTTAQIQLHHGVAYALYALGRAADAGDYARSIIDKIPFEDSLAVQFLLIRSYDFTGNDGKTIFKCLEVLREVGIDFPASPSPETVIVAMNEAKFLASQYDFDQIPYLHQDRICEKTRNVLKIMDVVSSACFQNESPYLPLVASAMVIYSLMHGVCEESASAFGMYGYFMITTFGQFNEAKKYGNVAFKILERARNQRYVRVKFFVHFHSFRMSHISSVLFSVIVRARVILMGYVSVWFLPLKASARHLLETYKIGMTVGDVDGAMLALVGTFDTLCYFLSFLYLIIFASHFFRA